MRSPSSNNAAAWARVVHCGALILLAQPTAILAQDVQLSGFAGWRFGGSGRSPISGQQIDIGGATSFGGSASLWLWGPSWVELNLSRAVGVARPAVFGGDERDLELSYLQLGYVHELQGTVVRPFLGASIGAARIREASEEARTLFSAGVVGGLRAFAGRHVGLRLDGRLLLALDGQRRGRSRNSLGDSGITIGGSAIFQAELTIGVVVAF